MDTRLRRVVLYTTWALAITLSTATLGQTPRSESILFVSNHEEPGRTNALYLMTPFGSTVRRFLPDITGVASPRWSPNGSQIALTMWPNGGGEWSRVHVVDSDGANLRVLFPTHEGSAGPAWAPDASRIAFVGRFDGMPEVYVGDIQGEDTQLVGHRVDERFKAGLPSSAPSWSPDGTRIAFTANKHNNWESARYIWTMKPDGSDMRELVTHESQNDWPAYSPDGSTIAFASDRNGRFEIYTIRTDGSRLRRLTDTGDDQRPRWSPDGKQIVFYRGVRLGLGKREIHVIDANGRNPLQLTDFGERARSPDWFDPAYSVSSAMRQVLAWGWLKQLSSAR